MLTIVVFIFILGILVFVHEFGHFIVARRNGIKTEEFGLGFPPRIVGIQFIHGIERKKVPEVKDIKIETVDVKVGKEEIIKQTITEKIKKVSKKFPVEKWRIIWGSKDGDDENEKQDIEEAREKNFAGGTIYSLNWFPIGGFVRIKGEDGGEKKDPDSFSAKSPRIRIKVLIAGVAMNFILAWVLFSVAFMLGSFKDVTGENAKGSKILIEGIEENSPADKMGLKIGDIIIGNGENLAFSSVSQVQKYINENRGKEISLKVERGKKELILKGIPREQTAPEQGALGISGFGEVIVVKYPFFKSIWMGFLEIGNMFKEIIRVIGKLFVGEKTGIEIMGPVKLAIFTGEILPLGFVFLLRFIAIFSINLGVINILPFPALDGGRILFILIEKIKGSAVSHKIEQVFHAIGMFLLLALMLFITIREIFTPEMIDRIKSLF